ncbi:hypothetical protein HDU76_013849 [Blyttiomyces sp. JEL0837]|nr:hypothetical protein HDU76_013849 [Blyttiomyces sp. JEL0837]
MTTTKADQTSIARRTRLAIKSLQWFCETSLDEALLAAENANGDTAPTSAKESLMHLVRSSHTGIPAYEDFYRNQKVNISACYSSDELLKVLPFLSKANFINEYSLAQRCLNGDLSCLDFAHFSSGSGGKPTVWGRFSSDEISVAFRFEQILRDSFQADALTSLAVVAFPLGSWVGGLYTTLCLRYICAKGYPVTLVTPGNDVLEIIRVVKELSPQFQQTIILGYPPFIKTVIDSGRAASVPWSTYNLRMVFAGEVFSEEWRSMVAQRAGISDPLTSMVSIFGTADAGVLACETPFSARIRKWIAERPEIARKLFGRDRLPSLMQYDPNSRFMEMRPDDNTIVFSTLPSTFDKSEPEIGVTSPLIRYSIGDAGGLISYTDMINFIKTESNGTFSPIEETAASDPSRVIPIRKMPFVYVFGRAFWTVSLYGANVYVDHVMVGLETDAVRESVTGKFVLAVCEDSMGDTRLSVTVELAAGVEESEKLRESILNESILNELKRLNSEYGHYVSRWVFTCLFCES